MLPAMMAAGPMLDAVSNLTTGVAGAIAGPPPPPEDSSKAAIKQLGSRSKDVYQYFSLNPVLIGAGAQTLGAVGSAFSPELSQRREFAGGNPTASASLAKATEGGTATSDATATGAGAGFGVQNMLIVAVVGVAAFLLFRYLKK